MLVAWMTERNDQNASETIADICADRKLEFRWKFLDETLSVRCDSIGLCVSLYRVELS